MLEKGILIQEIPVLKDPLLIAGFDGWGNAMNISTGMVSYLIRKLGARPFAKINPDPFYRYDESRPIVHIANGRLKNLTPPGGSFFATPPTNKDRSLILLQAAEPALRWNHFVSEIFALCQKLNVRRIIMLGSMYDNVIHTDRIISGIASTEALSDTLNQKNINAVSYSGPGAIHSTLMAEGTSLAFECISLWSHCPYYLQGTTHYGLLAYLGKLLSFLGAFALDTEELETNWQELNDQIQALVEKNPSLQSAIDELRKAKVRGSWERMREADKKTGNVINLKDFLDPA